MFKPNDPSRSKSVQTQLSERMVGSAGCQEDETSEKKFPFL
jgi:hypothetical protein